jgi:murein DD-endopeptidase MepM/ murein hydrolase activator NlpD
MSNLHLLNNGPRKNNSKGFYIALGVCLIAIGVAAWTTYDSVVNYTAPDEKTTSSAVAKQTNEAVSGIKVINSEPAVVSSEAPASQAASSAAPKKTAASVPAKKTVAPALTFSYPVGSSILQKYSGQNLAYSKTMKDWRAHTGTDFAAKQGEAVKAVADGTVKNVYVDGLYGNTVVIAHGDVEAYYCGLYQTTAKKGVKVKQGDKIGTVGTAPMESADSAHFHLSMKKNGKFIDPMTVLK